MPKLLETNKSEGKQEMAPSYLARLQSRCAIMRRSGYCGPPFFRHFKTFTNSLRVGFAMRSTNLTGLKG